MVVKEGWFSSTLDAVLEENNQPFAHKVFKGVVETVADQTITCSVEIIKAANAKLQLEMTISMVMLQFEKNLALVWHNFDINNS